MRDAFAALILLNYKKANPRKMLGIYGKQGSRRKRNVSSSVPDKQTSPGVAPHLLL